ncbi:MAG: RNA polymerase sigma factor [Limisphaerales bacterium]
MSTDRPPPADTRTPHRAVGVAFAVTRWTLVLRAKGGSPEARAALGELCEAYYAPVMAFIRWTVGDAEKARDLTQEFFARLLAKEGFHGLEPGRGRFRAYLLGAVKNFLADQLGREQAAKRGGGIEPASLQPPTDTSPGFEVIDDHSGSVASRVAPWWAFTA